MASPLTLLMPLLPNANLAQLAQTLASNQTTIDNALTSIGTVHFARFLVLDRSTANLQPGGASGDQLVLAVITEYDGSFQAYIGDFVSQIGGVFDALLAFVVGGQELIPVANHLNAFSAFVAANDASQHQPNEGLYSAYPQTVQQILAAVG